MPYLRIKPFWRIVRAVFGLFSGFFMPNLAKILHPQAPSWSNHRQHQAFLMPPFWADWLFDAGSLTARLTSLRPNGFSVLPTKQFYGYPTTTEQQELGLHKLQTVWVREVILQLDNTPIVHARTAIPLSTLTGAEKRLQSLGTRSLGSYLFKQPHLKRGQLVASRCQGNDLGLLWSRRSIFYLGDKGLMVSEAFTEHLKRFTDSSL